MSRIYGITNQGVNLIRRAREENRKVTISRVLLSSQYEDDGNLAELFGRPVTWYDLGEGVITAVNASNSLTVGISLPDTPQGSLVKSFAVFASYAGKEVMLYALSDPNAALILGGAPYNFTMFMSINAADVVDNFGEVADADDTLVQQVSALGQRVDTLGQQVDTLGQQVSASGQQVDTLGQQVNALEQQVTASEQQVDTLGQQVNALEQQVDTLGQQVTASGQQIDTFGQQVTALEQQIAGEYISQVSYDEETGVMSFKSQDGSRQIDINLA